MPGAEQLTIPLHVNIEAITEDVLPSDLCDILRKSFVVIFGPDKYAERLRPVLRIEGIQYLETEQPADLVVIAVREQRMDDARCIRAAC